MKAIFLYSSIFICFIFAQIGMAYDFPGFCDVNIYKSTTHVPPTKHPPKTLIDNTSKCVCVVKITFDNGSVAYQTGELFDPQLVVTSMHGFLNWDSYGSPLGLPCTDYSKVEVLFGFYSGALPTTGWIKIKNFDPKPTQAMQDDQTICDVKDFIVLQLETPQSISNVAKFDKSEIISPIPIRPFILHHPALTLQPGSLVVQPMEVSYDYIVDQSMTFNSSGFSTSTRNYSGWGGSSGGGIFWSDDIGTNSKCGTLIGIVCHTWPTTEYSGSGTKPYITRGPGINNLFNKHIGATKLLPLMGYQLTDNLSTDQLNTVWGVTPSPELMASAPSKGYKYESQHFVNTPIWYAYGDDFGDKIASLPLNSLFSGKPQKGTYRVYVDMMRSTSCVQKGTMNAYSGTCSNLNTSSGKITTTVEYNSIPNKLTDLTNFDFYSKVIGHNQGTTVNDNISYSGVEKFDLGTVYIDPTNYTYHNIVLKVQSALKWRDGANDDIVQALSIHGANLVYEPDANPPPPPPTPGQNECDKCLTKEVRFNSGLNYSCGGQPVKNCSKFYIDWGDGGKDAFNNSLPNFQEVTPQVDKVVDGVTYDFYASHKYVNGSYTASLAYENNCTGTTYDYTGFANRTRIKNASVVVNCPTPTGDPVLNNQGEPTSLIGTVGTKIHPWPKNQGGMLKSWYVNWGDGFTQTFNNLIYSDDHVNPPGGLFHTYSAIGSYQLTVTATNIANPPVSKTLNYTVTINPVVGTPDIQITPTEISRTQSTITYSFSAINTKSEIGPITGYSWSFPLDGGTTNIPSGTHVFTRSNLATQTVSPVVLAGTCGGGTGVSTIFVSVPPNLPIVTLSSTLVSSTSTSATYTFNAVNTGGSFENFSWYISEPSLTNIIKTNPTTFTYQFKQRPFVSNVQTKYANDPSNTNGPSTYISVPQLPPVLSIVASKPEGVAPLSVAFTIANTGGDIQTNTYLWDFGDGETSTEIAPTHIYKKPGKYTATFSAKTYSNVAYSTQKAIWAKPNIVPILNLLLGD